jgi:hypothetical protein
MRQQMNERVSWIPLFGLNAYLNEVRLFMNAKKSPQLESADDRKRLQRALDQRRNGAPFALAGFNASQFGDIPTEKSGQLLRQNALLSTQQRHGNAFVQRMLGGSNKQPTIFRVSDEGVCPTCGRRGRGRCSGCGQMFKPAAALNEQQTVAQAVADDQLLMKPLSSMVQRSFDVGSVPGVWLQRQATQPPPVATFWQRWGSQITMLKRMFREQRYGCWCGPGNVCDGVTDRIDACCKRHDLDYAAAGVTSEDPAPPGQYNMWGIEGFKRTMVADARLVACTQATKYDWRFYGPTAALYREGVALIFGMRATIAAWIMSKGF